MNPKGATGVSNYNLMHRSLINFEVDGYQKVKQTSKKMLKKIEVKIGDRNSSSIKIEPYNDSLYEGPYQTL